MRRVYADNGSTSFPKAPGISDSIKAFLDDTGCNLGRSNHAGSYDVAAEILDTRQMLADMFGAQSPREVIFTPSVTYSLNMLLKGFLKNGDHAITTSMEHNAVMRPLHELAKAGVAYDCVPCAKDGSLNPDDVAAYIKKGTKVVVMTHASNVCGTVMPVQAVAEICERHDIKLIVDAAQTAGVLEIGTDSADALAFAGHKGLLGAQGLGGFVIKREFAEQLSPLITGGTGSLSHDIEHPNFLPDKFEAGTINIPAIIGLKRALEYIAQVGIKSIHDTEMRLAMEFISKLRGIGGAEIIGKEDVDGRIAVVSVDFPGRDNAEIAHRLDSEYGIITRCGLHCAPLAHKTLGTYPHGTVRFSFGHLNTEDEVDYIARTIKEILSSGGGNGF